MQDKVVVAHNKYLYFIALLLSACGNNPILVTYNELIAEPIVFMHSNADSASTFDAMEVDEERKLLVVLDEFNTELHIYNTEDGSQHSVISGIGQIDGCLLDPRLMTIDREYGYVHVYDHDQRKIESFNYVTGTHINTLRLPDRKMILGLGAQCGCIYTTIDDANYLITVFGIEGDSLGSFGVPFTHTDHTMRKILNTAHITFLDNHQTAVLFHYHPAGRVFDEKGNLLKEFSYDSIGGIQGPFREPVLEKQSYVTHWDYCRSIGHGTSNNSLLMFRYTLENPSVNVFLELWPLSGKRVLWGTIHNGSDTTREGAYIRYPVLTAEKGWLYIVFQGGNRGGVQRFKLSQ